MKQLKEFKDLINSIKTGNEKDNSLFKTYESISNHGYEIDGYKRAEYLFKKFLEFYSENKEKYSGRIEEVFLDFEKLDYIQSELKDFHNRFCNSVIRYLNIDMFLINKIYFDNIVIPDDMSLSELIDLTHEFIKREFENFKNEGEE